MRVIAAFLVAFCLPVLSLAAVGVVGNGAEVTCGTSPTVMDDPSIEDRYTRTLLACVPAGSNHVFVGGEGVTVGSGLEIGGDIPCYRVTLAPNAKVYCIASSPTKVKVQESR